MVMWCQSAWTSQFPILNHNSPINQKRGGRPRAHLHAYLTTLVCIIDATTQYSACCKLAAKQYFAAYSPS
jgi:hypothetical protein